jgi:hypothetical protein
MNIRPSVAQIPIGEISVEEWHSVDAPIRNAQVTRLRINPA